MQRLADDTAQQLRACTQIPEFSAAICALVLNAVEADACHILVEVDASQYSATVTDNGHGICFDSMKLLGVRCCSSKLHAKGDALASLAQMSTLTVSSRAKGCFETYHKQITPSNSLQAAEPPHATARANGISIISLCAVPRSSQGTTIELSNFMFNQPVRRRRAASKGVDATLQEVKAALHALMLPFTGIELILRLVDSKASLLHVVKVRLKGIVLQDIACCAQWHLSWWEISMRHLFNLS
jgi:DNA mismatch repair ATPase MutL